MFSLLLLTAPTIWEILTDHAEWKKDVRDKKGQDVIIRGVIMITVAALDCLVVNPEAAFWQSLLLTFGIFVMFFDYIMGILLTKNPFFLGTTSQTDRFWRFIPWYCGLLVRGTVLAIAVILYKYLELVELLLNLIFI